MKKLLSVLFSFLLTSTLLAQATLSHSFADSIRLKYHIPELAYAVISSDSVYEMQVAGVQRIHTEYIAQVTDQFRIGSNTKAITGFIAAQLVKQGKIRWDTKFFDLFPELKATSNEAYHDLTLINLLSFRTRLFPYTYTYPEPTKDQFTGNEDEQRYQFTQWFFKQNPVGGKKEYYFSNLGYTAAGLMLEKASGKSYKTLVAELGEQLGIQFNFGPPNTINIMQPWGHDSHLYPEYPADSYKLNWLLAAGNISISLPDYIKFIQLQLQGLNGQSPYLTKEEFTFLHYGLDGFSVGWFQETDEHGQLYSYNIGNPGTFLSKVYVYPQQNKAYIFLTNAQTEDVDRGIDVLYEQFKNKYNKE